MASTRRRLSTGFSSSAEEIEEIVEETSAEVVEEIVEEEEVVEVVKLAAAIPSPAPILNNPKPVAKRDAPRRNTPRFSAQR